MRRILALSAIPAILAVASPAHADVRELPPRRTLCTTETATYMQGRVTYTRQLTTCPNGYRLLVTATGPNGKTHVVKNVDTVRILPRR